MPGQVLHKVPLFGWAIFVTAILLLLSLPVLAGRYTMYLHIIFVCSYMSSIFYYSLPLIPITAYKYPKDIRIDGIPQYLKEIIIGLALGDLYMRRKSKNTTLNFKQSNIHSEYIYHLYSLFQEYCQQSPRVYTQVLKGKEYQCIVFDTLSYEAFNYYHELFYTNKVKTVPSNIGELLTVKGLAYWAMDDGGPDRSGFILYTNAFTKDEVELLIKVLKRNFDLNCSIHTRTDKKKAYMIYIKADSWKKFKTLIEPYIIPHFSYKLILRGSRVIQKKGVIIWKIYLNLID